MTLELEEIIKFGLYKGKKIEEIQKTITEKNEEQFEPKQVVNSVEVQEISSQRSTSFSSKGF